MIDGTKWDFFRAKDVNVAGQDSFFLVRFFANAFINEIKSLNL